MKIINLAATTDKIQIKLAGNVAATQLDWTCSFYDTTIADGTVLEGVSTGVTNNTTAVDICAAPASGHVRTVKSITVYNADSATAIPIIIFNANGTERVLARNSLTPLASWSTDDMSFYTDISGKVDKSLYDANSILYATTDDTPAALTVGEQTLVGRITGGQIDDLSVSQVITLLNVLPLAGGTITGVITLAENAAIAHEPVLSADGKFTGLTIAGTAGAALAFGDLVYLDPTDSRRELVDANSAAGADGDARGILGICVLAAAGDGSATNILLNGVVRADTTFPTFTINAPIYVSETAGDVVVTQPTTTDVVIRVVGFGLTADSMYFNPSNDFITHT